MENDCKLLVIFLPYSSGLVSYFTFHPYTHNGFWRLNLPIFHLLIIYNYFVYTYIIHTYINEELVSLLTHSYIYNYMFNLYLYKTYLNQITIITIKTKISIITATPKMTPKTVLLLVLVSSLLSSSSILLTTKWSYMIIITDVVMLATAITIKQYYSYIVMYNTCLCSYVHIAGSLEYFESWKFWGLAIFH